VIAIRTQALRKTFGSVVGLEALDLEVTHGTVFGFLGPNGAGKTTTLRLLAGLSHPTAGQAWIAGMPVGPDGPARSVVGYLPEEPRAYPWMTAREFLADFVGGLFRMDRRQARARADELLEEVGLTEVARRRIGGFSRGMRQRLGVAQALMNGPRVLLLDEPVSALDPGGRRDMLAMIGRLKTKATVFMSTHILEDVERICDTIGILSRGRLIALEDRQVLLNRYALPAVEVEFDAEARSVEAWAARVRQERTVTEVDVRGTSARVRIDGSPDARRSVQRSALTSGMTILRYEVARPTLEDVFLRMVES
jgi:ABC-2 type transport system ATP-binding protein